MCINQRVSKYMKQKLIDPKGDSAIVVGNLRVFLLELIEPPDGKSARV